MNRAAVNGSVFVRRSYYEVAYIPEGLSETLTRREPTDEFADDDVAVDFLVEETYLRGDEPIAITRSTGETLWENRSYITPEEPLL